MFKQYFGSNSYQNNSCPKFCMQVDALPEIHANETTGHRKQKRYKANDGDGQKNALECGHVSTGKRDAYG